MRLQFHIPCHRLRRGGFLFGLILILLLPARVETAQALPEQLATGTGERLIYEIRWSFIPAADASLTAVKLAGGEPSLAQEPVYRFSLQVNTKPFLDLLYKYWEQIDSYTPLDLTHSLLYKKQQGGHSRRDIVVLFDWQKQQAQYSNFQEPLPPIAVAPETLDPLSALYYVRSQPLVVGDTIVRPVTDGKKSVIGSVTVLGKERVEIGDTTYDTIKIEPEMKDVKGVFEKSKNAKMHIWITDDPRRLVVKLKSKVIIGSFIAELVDVQTAEADDLAEEMPERRMKERSGATDGN